MIAVRELPAATDARLARGAATAIRAAIRLAGGREVCFVCTIDDEGTVQTARAVARGNIERVLALPGVAQRGELLVHNHPSGLLEPSDADLTVAARLHDAGVGFAIVDNEASELFVVVEVPRVPRTAPIDAESVAGDLGPDGPVAAAHPRFEDRPSQQRMAAAIATLYNEGGVGLLEAGTGVGKSLGYLVPALRWAAKNGERTVVSTNTINLQEQLVGKDLPFLERALADQKVRFALLKGWRNYLCLQRLDLSGTVENALFDEGLRAEVNALRGWAASTSDGSLSDLATPPRAEAWDEVAAEPDLCGRTKCGYFDRCFLFKARRRAAQADVIVVNHHLLLSDVAVRRAQQNWEDAAVLPPYTRLVVDEGHHLEDAAAAHLGTTVTRRSLARMFNRLERKGKGLLGALVARLAASGDLLSTASLDLVESRLAPAVHAARDRSALVFDLLDLYLREHDRPIQRLTASFADDPEWSGGLGTALEDLLRELALLDDGLRIVRERLEGDARVDDTVLPLLAEMHAISRRLQSAGDGLRAALAPAPGPETVRWIEVRGKERNVAATSVPLDLAPILRDDLFERVRTAIVTSATLATPAADGTGSFAFLARRLGLDGAETAPHTAVFPSPFDYHRQALLVIPPDMPAPNADAAGHFERLVRLVLDHAEAADGGLFVLFTSHRDVRSCANELRARGADRRWPLLVHGEDGRDALLNRFRDAGRALLLGTASFWEGVDVPGEALRGLVIARLPFRVPTEPVTAAHSEAIAKRGGEPFTEYMLPHAALRLKQGFGRLIRGAADRGVVIIADPRCVTRRYGRSLLETLPPARRLVVPWERARDEVVAFYRSTAP